MFLIKISSFVQHAVCLVQVTEVTNYLPNLTNFLSLKLLGGCYTPPTPPGSNIPEFKDQRVRFHLKSCTCITSDSSWSILYLQIHVRKMITINLPFMLLLQPLNLSVVSFCNIPDCIEVI